MTRKLIFSALFTMVVVAMASCTDPNDDGPTVGQTDREIISVTDSSLLDWENIPEGYLFETTCAPNASMNGLKSVKVYANKRYIYLLVEVNDEVIIKRKYTPFYIFVNADNNTATGGYGDQWITADVDFMMEGGIFIDGENGPYNPLVYKWWGEDGENGWQWFNPSVETLGEEGWGPFFQSDLIPLGFSQIVDGKVEIQLQYKLIPLPFDDEAFTIGFAVQEEWVDAGILPNADDAADGSQVLAEKLQVLIDK